MPADYTDPQISYLKMQFQNCLNMNTIVSIVYIARLIINLWH